MAGRPDRRRCLGWCASLLLCATGALALGVVRAADPADPAGPAGPAGGASSASAPADAIVGDWVTQARDGIIQISMTAAGLYQGRVIGGSNPHRLDEANPDPARRHLELLGEIIMGGMHYEGEHRWSGGTIYDPANGHTYRCRLQLRDGGHLQVRGFLGIALLGRSQIWTRYLGRSMLLPRLP